MRQRILAGVIVVCGLAAGPAAADEAPRPLRMSISTTLFEGMSEPLMKAMVVPFRALLKLQTGLDGEIVLMGDGARLADHLADDKLEVAVMEGIEFAWVRAKHPELRPLMLAVNEKASSRSLLLVRAGGRIKTFGDLQGKTVADFRFTRIFSRLYLDRRARQVAGVPAHKFFARRARGTFAEDIIEDVLEGKIEAAIVEDVCADCYRRRKPERSKMLHVLEQSEAFPASVVVYKPGRLNRDTLKRLHDGMLDAGSSVLGRQLMTLWQMTGFERVPPTYEPALREILKLYPPPGKLQVSRR